MSVIPIIISAMLLLVLLIAGIFVYIILISYVLEFHLHLCPIRASSLVLSSTFGISDVLWCCSGLEKGILGGNAVGRWLTFNSRCERFVLVLRFYGGFGDLSWDLCCWRVRKIRDCPCPACTQVCPKKRYRHSIKFTLSAPKTSGLGSGIKKSPRCILEAVTAERGHLKL